jgi:UTP--glucose-1-phosphate uridylyltransferase
MMNVRKAVITAAGRGTRQYAGVDAVPGAMFPLVDRDGIAKPVIQIIAEEAVESGIEEICVVVAPGDEATYRQAFGEGRPQAGPGGAEVWPDPQSKRVADLGRRLRFVVQERPEGFGHSVWCAREFVGSEPFLLLVGDHLYVSGEERRCARQILDLASQEGCSVAAVQATREHLIHQYGTVAGKRFSGRSNVFQIEQMIEKPTPSVAEQRLYVPGLRVGHYLCFFGMHVLTPALFDILDEHVQQDRRDRGKIELTPVLEQLARRERYLALQTNGRRYDIGVKYGFLEAQVAFAMSGVDRDQVLTRMTELLLQFQQGCPAETAVPLKGPAQPGSAAAPSA